MKIIVTHSSPDLDAITSVWLLKKYLPGWDEAEVKFVPAGERLTKKPLPPSPFTLPPIETVGDDEIIHVDTGLGPLDHHETSNDKICAASRTWDYVQLQNKEFNTQISDKTKAKKESLSRIVKIVTAIDHFKEVFWENPTADYHEFSLFGILEGLKIQKPDCDSEYVIFVMQCLDSILHNFDNRLWAEKEILNNGKEFTTRFGKGIGFETINDTVIKLAQKMGYVVVIRKDPRKGYVRIKARPNELDKKGVDLSLTYEQLCKMDPSATWYLHVSKKMLLNGTVKNPKMIPSTLSLDQLIKVLEKV